MTAFLFCHVALDADPSVIYSTGPLAVKLPYYKSEEKERREHNPWVGGSGKSDTIRIYIERQERKTRRKHNSQGWVGHNIEYL